MKRATVQLECDGCAARRQGKPGVPADELRAELASVGWWSANPGDRDLCPTCRAKAVNEAKAKGLPS